MNRRTKSGFGVAEIGLSAIELLLQIYLLELYVTVGLSPLLAGSALAIAVIWDAVSDPLMGLISDQTRAKSAVGKRLPYFFAGAFLMGVAFVFLFSPGAAVSQLGMFSYLLFWYLVLNTALTLVGVPHLAIISDLSNSKAERAELFSWRLVFGGLGLLLGLIAPVLVANINGQEGLESSPTLLIENRSQVGWWIAGISVPLACITGWAVWKPLAGVLSSEIPSEQSEFSWKCLISAFQSKLFLLVTGGFVFIALGRAFNSSLALLFYKNRLEFSENQIAMLLLLLTLAIMAAVPIWLTLSRRFDKGSLCVAGVSALTALTAVSYPMLPVGALIPVLIVAVIGGVLVACVALLEAMFSDVIEVDQESSSAPLTGAYYGIWKMATKIARALGIACSGFFLSAIGFVEGSVKQTERVELSITWAFGPGVALFFGIGGLFIYKASKAFKHVEVPEDSGDGQQPI